MKWLSKKPKPKRGDRREHIRFAWLPRRLDDGYTVWMETYSVTQVYVPAVRCWVDDKTQHRIFMY
jgi:hypothetical protein